MASCGKNDLSQTILAQVTSQNISDRFFLDIVRQQEVPSVLVPTVLTLIAGRQKGHTACKT